MQHPFHRHRSHVLGALAAALLAAGPAAAQAPAPAARSVVINSVRLPDEQVRALERTYRIGIADGRYWYDRATGAWGVEGGPCLGLVLPGLAVGGALRADASGGGTGVFVNGRELHRLDVAALMRFTAVYPGRYWLDAHGNGGPEGGPMMFNLYVLARQAGGGGPWGHTTKSGDLHVGGDGQGFTYFMSKDSSWSSGP
jgi:hypothetical protein